MMTDKATLLALADRVEALEGPCFDTEDEIEKSTGKPWRFPSPNYTASIDAAMTIVPKGCGWIVDFGQDVPNEPMGGARIFRHAAFAGYDVDNDCIAEAEATTPALALTAAALRALAKDAQ